MLAIKPGMIGLIVVLPGVRLLPVRLHGTAIPTNTRGCYWPRPWLPELNITILLKSCVRCSPFSQQKEM
eukprot:10524705-Prorocentrum_lima.AAC.1